jgi:hypothetical protein
MAEPHHTHLPTRAHRSWHADALNADNVAEVAELLVRRGYRFVPLEEALRDPGCGRPLSAMAS